jgi:hypothetical protein
MIFKSRPRHDRPVCSHRVRRRLPGQAAIIIALASIALIGATGLAVDGGSMYAQRRNAQNAADAGAMAITRVMLDKYDVMILDNAEDIDGTAADEQDLKNVLASYADMHKVTHGNIKAYYVNDAKQLVTNAEVGSYGGIPWTQGAKGITVKAHSETGAMFMKLFGWEKVGADANATAFMGVGQTERFSNVPLLPVGYFTYTNMLENFNLGTSYRIFDHGEQLPGNFGFIDFNGNGGPTGPVSVWFDCGFNPAATTQAEWDTWCPAYAGDDDVLGPTLHYGCDDADCSEPSDPEIYVPYLRVGVGTLGWWNRSSSGNTTTSCKYFQDEVEHDRNFYIPIYDGWTGSGMSDSRYHLARIGIFHITDDDITCNPSSTEYIDGTFQGYEDYVSGGQHGDIRHSPVHTVFMDN